MTNPLVSVIVPMKNSRRTIGACLDSISQQTYKPIEIIVADNGSSDESVTIAQTKADKILDVPGLRTTVRNTAVRESSGELLLHIDSDMVLSPDVIEQCVTSFQSGNGAVIIPEIDWVSGFWMHAATFERRWARTPALEGARFLSRDLFNAIGGYNECLESGEDFDLHFRVIREGVSVGRIESKVQHDIRNLTIREYLNKKAYYATSTGRFMEINADAYWRHRKRWGERLWDLRKAAVRRPLQFFGWLSINAAIKARSRIERHKVQSSTSTAQ